MPRKIISFCTNILNSYAGLRYFIAGGSAGVTDLVILYFLYEVLHIHYLISAILAFIVAFFMSFLLHKFWTFKSHQSKTHKQMMMYFGSTMFGLTLNTLLMYLLVDHLYLNVILSQIIAGLLVACVSFFILRNIVFKFNKLEYEASSIYTENR